MIHLNPDEVDNSESSKECVLGVLAGTHLETLEDTTDETRSLGEALIDEVLEGTSVPQ